MQIKVKLYNSYFVYDLLAEWKVEIFGGRKTVYCTFEVQSISHRLLTPKFYDVILCYRKHVLAAHYIPGCGPLLHQYLRWPGPVQHVPALWHTEGDQEGRESPRLQRPEVWPHQRVSLNKSLTCSEDLFYIWYLAFVNLFLWKFKFNLYFIVLTFFSIEYVCTNWVNLKFWFIFVLRSHKKISQPDRRPQQEMFKQYILK